MIKTQDTRHKTTDTQHLNNMSSISSTSHNSPPIFLVVEEDYPPYYIYDGLQDYLARVEYNEDVIFFNEGEAYTAYKHVDHKVKPVPAVFPEEAKVIWKFPEDPLSCANNVWHMGKYKVK